MNLAVLNGRKFQDVLRQTRLTSGMSQTQLAEIVDVAQPVVSCWERGEHYPSIERIARLEQVFGLERGALLVRAAYEILSKQEKNS